MRVHFVSCEYVGYRSIRTYFYVKVRIPVTSHLSTSQDICCIILLGNLILLTFQLTRIDLSLDDFQCNPIHVEYQKQSCNLLLGNVFQLFSKLPRFEFPLVDHQLYPHPCYLSQKSCIILLEIFSNLFLNCQTFISPLLITNITPISVQYHKTIFIPIF